jgi:hypothetical protein
MKTAEQIVFRRITRAEFYNINKLKGSEAGGGGQGYIDFPTSTVPPAAWRQFFVGETMLTTKSGPLWRFTVNNIGLGMSQIAEIGQRAKTRYNIRAQKLGTAKSNRLYAWHPDRTGFPRPSDPTKRVGVDNLVVYLIRTTDGEFWAGWFKAKIPDSGWQVDDRLYPLFNQDDGYIGFLPGIDFDEADGRWPFQTAIAPAAAPLAPAKPAHDASLPPPAALAKTRPARPSSVAK